MSKPEPRTYGRHRAPEDVARCIESVWHADYMGSLQCTRKRGHGTDGLYCKGHDPVAKRAREEAKRAEWQARFDAKCDRQAAVSSAVEYVRDLAKGGDKRAAAIVARLGA
jgi:hypothetical protein